MNCKRTFCLGAILALSCVLFISRGLAATGSDDNPVVTDETLAGDQKIMSEIADHSELMSNLEYLSDMIGQRLTGSENLKKANDWTKQKFADYGLTNPHLESWQIAHTWIREEAHGFITSPARHPLSLASFAWAPGTSGTVRGSVVYVDAHSMDELERYKGKLKNAMVITSQPALLPAPDEPAINPMLVPYGDFFLLVAPKRPSEKPIVYGPDYIKFVRARADFFRAEGVSAMLVDSGKPDTLLNMTGLGGREYAISPISAAFVTSENYSLIWRLMKRGRVEVELNITNTIGDKPTEVYNTIAEIRGSEKPDEYVIVGAHLDSWDLGTGTTDNGTGSMTVLEAARAIQKLGLKPKRTIRFVLFSGEEQGLCGSRAYVEAHKSELPKISAALVHDTGTGKVISFGLMENYQDMEIMEKVVAPLHPLGLLELSERIMGATDHAPFEAEGVPGFYAIQEPAEYFQTHHSQADTFDQARGPDLVEGAEAMAVTAFNIAQLPDLLPRKPEPKK
jgi:carboxypeptidase Q